MDGGYVLVHVLEASVPGTDLGDAPLCEVSLAESVVECPIPSTLQNENVVFATGGDAEPVVQVRSFASDRRHVGLVVVPLSTLVPLEVWNVWYAMDEGDDEQEEKPPEETAKMHLLLQYVSGEAAAEETPQLREMRAQDFLLRALQQLNAALEAKVLVHQSSSAQLPTLAHNLSVASVASVSQVALSQPPTTPSSPQLLGRVPNAATTLERNGSIAEIKQEKVLPAKPTKEAEEMLKRRVEPFKQVIAALEEKQRFFDDQELRINNLSGALEAHEQREHELSSKIYDNAQKCAAEVKAEQVNARSAHASKGALEQQIVELQQEVSLRKAHEDSLQKRVALMESELSVVHQKCVVIDSIEEQASSLKKEATASLQAKIQLQDQFDEQALSMAKVQEERLALLDDQRRELEQASAQLLAEKQSVELMQHTLESYKDIIRDKDAEKHLANEKLEDLERQAVTLEGEVGSYRTMLEREQKHRKEVEKKFGEQELKRLNDGLADHQAVIKQLRDENTKGSQELREERGRTSEFERELAALRSELSQEQARATESGRQLASQTELMEQMRVVRERNEELKTTIEQLHQDTRKITEHYEREIAEHSKNEMTLCAERDQMQQQIADLTITVGKEHQQVVDCELLREQMATNHAAVRQTAEQSENFQRDLQKSQQANHQFQKQREELHAEMEKVVARFHEQTLAGDNRVAELETLLEGRNNEIKLLMYRVQELSSKYVPVKGDAIDIVLAKWVNGYRPAVPFFRLNPGVYLFGRRQITCKISNDKPVFRVGGGFIGFDKFLELYASEELERLLSYELDESSGAPKFLEARKVCQTLEQAGAVEDTRDRVERGPRVQSRGPSTLNRSRTGNF